MDRFAKGDITKKVEQQIQRVAHLIETISIIREQSMPSKRSEIVSVVHDEGLYE
jgi:hypothetical protein